MADLDLVASHQPWTPLARLLDWDEVGDGSVYDGMPAEGLQPAEVLGDSERVRTLYAESIEYSLSALVSYVETYGGDNLVLVFLGDHQPSSVITGDNVSRDVPITIVAKDPAVLAKVESWKWDDGLKPGGTAPVSRMSDFRDQFLSTFSPPRA